MGKRNWSLPPNPLEVREDGVVVDSDVGIIDFAEGLEAISISAGIVQVSSEFSSQLYSVTCVLRYGKYVAVEANALMDSDDCLIKKVAC
jgi:hypothetical protein